MSEIHAPLIRPQISSHAERCLRAISVVLCIVACALLGAPTAALAENSQPATWRIGLIPSLSGPAGEQGKNWLQGAQLAAEELNRGRSTPRVTLFVEDDQTVPAKSVAAMQKLVRVDRVQGIIGGTWDFLAEAIYPLAASARIPFITPTNPTEILSEEAQQNPFVFTSAISIHAVREATREFLKRSHARSVAIFAPSLPFGTVQADMVAELARAEGISLTYRLDFPPEGGFSDSVRTFVLKIRDHRPDVVFAVVDYNILSLLTAEFERLQFMPKILTTQHLDAAFSLAQNPSQFRACFGVYPSSVLAGDFAKKYQDRYHESPRVFAAEGYDSLSFLIAALDAGVRFDAPTSPFSFQGIAAQYSIPPTRGRSLSDAQAVVMTTAHGRFEKWNPSEF